MKMKLLILLLLLLALPYPIHPADAATKTYSFYKTSDSYTNGSYRAYVSPNGGSIKITSAHRLYVVYSSVASGGGGTFVLTAKVMRSDGTLGSRTYGGGTYAAGSSGTVDMGYLDPNDTAYLSTLVTYGSPSNSNNVHVSAWGASVVFTDNSNPTPPNIGGTDNWETSQYVVIDGGTDDTGISGYQYSTDGVNWTNYISPLGFATTGIYTVYARSYDGVDNVSPASSKTIRVNTSPPNAPSINPTNVPMWNESNVVLISGSSSYSGVSRYEYNLDNTGWQQYTGGISIVSNGTHSLSARAVDNGGLISTTTSRNIYIDNVIPSPPSLTGIPGGWTNQDVRIYLVSGSTGPSGVSTNKIQFSGAWVVPWANYNSSILVSKEGVTVVDGRTISASGLSSINGTSTIKIDKTAPPPPTINYGVK